MRLPQDIVNWREKVNPNWIINADAGLIYGKHGRPLGYVHKRTGYVQLKFPRDKMIPAHRVIWESVNGPIPDGLQINHKNGIKHDNRLCNLEVVTPKENSRHAVRIGLKVGRKGEKQPMSKLRDAQIPLIRARIADGATQRQIAAEFSISPTIIYQIKKGQIWRHV